MREAAARLRQLCAKPHRALGFRAGLFFCGREKWAPPYAELVREGRARSTKTVKRFTNLVKLTWPCFGADN
jgi:hypothetical protein